MALPPFNSVQQCKMCGAGLASYGPHYEFPMQYCTGGMIRWCWRCKYEWLEAHRHDAAPSK